MISWKRISKTVFSAIFVVSLIGAVYFVPNVPDHYFWLDRSKFDIRECVKEETEHIIACGISAKSVQLKYLQLREYFGAEYINKKLEVYVANEMDLEGQIGYVNGGAVAGVYRKGNFLNDVIIYNGNENTLLHELSHYFHENMKANHKGEMFARLTELKLTDDYNYTLLNVKYKNLNARHMTLQNNFVNEINKLLRACSAKNKNKGVITNGS